MHTFVLPPAWYLGAGTRPLRAGCNRKALFITVRPPLTNKSCQVVAIA